MTYQPHVEVSISLDRYSDPIRVRVPLEHDMMMEVMLPVELSNESESLFLSQQTVQIKRKKLDMRSRQGEIILKKIENALNEILSAKDVLNGYSKKELAT